MSLKDEFKKFIHPYDDEDEPVEYQEDDYQDRPRRDDRRGQGGEHPRHHPAEGGAGEALEV